MLLQIFNAKRKSSMQVFINNNATFCFGSKKTKLSSSSFGKMQIWAKKEKNGKPYWWLFKKSESNGDSNDETESDIENEE